jgi:hypothetical protein
MTRQTTPGLGRAFRSQWPFLCGLLALPVFALIILVATLVSPGYSHVTDTISHLAGTGSPYPWIARIGLLFYGFMVLGFAYGLGRRLGITWAGKLLSAMLAINALAVLFTVLLGTTWGEVPLEAPMLGSSVHEAASRVGFTSLTVGIVLFPALIWRRPHWRRTRWVLQVLSLLIVGSGLFFVLEGFQDYSGVVQRIFFGACGVWSQVVALQVMRGG